MKSQNTGNHKIHEIIIYRNLLNERNYEIHEIIKCMNS